MHLAERRLGLERKDKSLNFRNKEPKSNFGATVWKLRKVVFSLSLSNSIQTLFWKTAFSVDSIF